MPEAIKCWEMRQSFDNFDGSSHQKTSRSHSNALTNEVAMIPSLHSSNYYYSSAYSNVFNLRRSNSIFNQLINSRSKGRNSHRNKSRSSNGLLSDSPSDESSLDRCSLRLMDECTFPQCNAQCPKLKNILGKEINFFDLLKAFDLKVHIP